MNKCKGSLKLIIGKTKKEFMKFENSEAQPINLNQSVSPTQMKDSRKSQAKSSKYSKIDFIESQLKRINRDQQLDFNERKNSRTKQTEKVEQKITTMMNINHRVRLSELLQTQNKTQQNIHQTNVRFQIPSQIIQTKIRKIQQSSNFVQKNFNTSMSIQNLKQICRTKTEEEIQCKIEQKLDYKKLISNMMRKNRQLEKLLSKIDSNYFTLKQANDKLMEQNKNLCKVYNKDRNINKHISQGQQEFKIKSLQKKLKKMKSDVSLTSIKSLVLSKQSNGNGYSSQLQALRQNHKKYESLANAMKESIGIVTGKSPKNLKSMWFEWQRIFESTSLQINK